MLAPASANRCLSAASNAPTQVGPLYVGGSTRRRFSMRGILIAFSSLSLAAAVFVAPVFTDTGDTTREAAAER